MQRTFDRELTELKKTLLHMGALVEQMIHRSTTAMVDRDAAIIEEVLDIEHEVNLQQIKIDDLAIKLIATKQPMASDLRSLITIARVNSELERIGDQSVNICENVEKLLTEPPLKPLIDLPIMAQEANSMVRRSLDSFVNGDTALAREVILNDDKVDALKDQIFRELLTYMMSDASTIRRSLSLILVSRNLERIGDHATNIAEEVIYLVQGRDVRHPRDLRQEKKETNNSDA